MEFGLLKGCDLHLVAVKEGLQLCFGGLNAIQIPLEKGVVGGGSGSSDWAVIRGRRDRGSGRGRSRRGRRMRQGTGVWGGAGPAMGTPTQRPQHQPGWKSRVARRLAHLK